MEKMRQQAIEILQSTENPRCQELLRQFVWANTTESRYKIGDAVYFRDPSVTCFRYFDKPDGTRTEDKQRVYHAIGRVKGVRRDLRARSFLYTLEYETDLEGGHVQRKKITYHTAAKIEEDLRPAPEYRITKWSELRG